MGFIEHIRRIQADEPSSDEESGSSPFSVPAPVSRRQSSAPATATPAAPAQLDESKTSSPKKKRDSAAATEEALTERAPKKVKSTEPSSVGTAKKAKDETRSPAAASTPASLTNGTKSTKKRARMDEEKASEGEQRAVKRVKPEDRSSAKLASIKAEAESSKKTMPAAAPAAQKPVDKMEYFERRVHDMLTDPLDFDDCVYDSNKPMSQHAARSFARNRRGQKQPPPPLEMSGAAGPASGTKPATPKSRGSGSLAKEAQKRAHQQKVNGHVERLKGKAVASSEPEEGIKGPVGGKQPVKVKANVGKRKERAWLTNSRKVERGGQQPQIRVRKYTQSAY
jgi:hypothetical protein